MATLADSLNSSTARALAVKMRPDLVTEQGRYQGQLYWIVKDPLGLAYFRFQEEEFAILNMLDGQTSLDDMKTRFEKQFAPQKITLDELGRLVGMLHRSHLVIADLPGQGEQLLKLKKETNKRELWGKLTNILAIRFKGIDPERMLVKLLPWFGWLFTWRGAILVGTVVFSALLLVFTQFDIFQRKLPTFHEFFAAKNWIYLAVAMGITKIFHEFGHGLSCKKFGGECHEMGMMLLVFTPCLYCNVTDSWMLPNKWQRAMIGAAGIYVELLIAGFATFGWWFSQPGLFNYLCLSTMFVCSVSTIMFNANPLMRYDGYYILSDISEIPNLRQKSTTILGRKLGAWCLGLKEHDDPFLPQRNQIFFALYSIAATAYMWLVSFSILFFMYRIFEDNELKIFGQLLAAMSLVTLLFVPLWRVVKFFYVPGRMDQVKPHRLMISLSIIAVLLAGFFFLPLPYRIFCPLEVKPNNAGSVFVDAPGTLTDIFVRAGDHVKKGQALALLTNDQLELEIKRYQREMDELKAEIETLSRATSLPNSDAHIQLESKRKHYAAAVANHAQRVRDRERLLLTAPIDGMVIDPPALPDRGSRDNQVLPKWNGSPLDLKNKYSTLERATLFCQIGDPHQLEGVMVVNQSEIYFIHNKQKVEIMLDGLPGREFSTELLDLSQEKIRSISHNLSQRYGGQVETKPNERGEEVPISAAYQARVAISDKSGELLPGMRGMARIHASKQTLWQRTWRVIAETFNFEL